jgi:pimeloyl-ACP methyl ester carboxylesterase
MKIRSARQATSRRASRAVALAAIGFVLVPGVAVAKGRTGPAGDAFYTPPSPLPGHAHGDLIWQRPLTGTAVDTGAARTLRVLYRSSGSGGPTVPVSGVVSIPKGKAPKGGWPVVTYAHGTTGIADSCAPSRNPHNRFGFGLLSRWLKAGYAVVRTDYEGLGTPGVHPYLVGTSEGPGVLDIVRAARQADSRISRAVAIVGGSQGGHAALWAAALARRYTPELHVKGTVALAPASHIDDQLPLVAGLTTPGGALSATVALVLRGIATAQLSLDIASLLSAQAAALYPRALADCISRLARSDSFGGLSPAAMFVAHPDLTALIRDLDAEDPSHLKIPTPVLIEQGTRDTTVLPVFTDALARELRAAGVKLAYKKYPGLDHAGVQLRRKPTGDAYAYVTDRLG